MLEQKGDKSDPEVAAWVEWRSKNKPSKPTLLSQVNRTPVAFANQRTSSSTATAPPALPTAPHPQMRQTAAAASAAVQQQQSVVLPARTTPLAVATSAASVVNQLLKSQPQPAAKLQGQIVGAGPNVQTLKLGGQTAQVCVCNCVHFRSGKV